MGNDDQLTILRQGSAAWNKWRRENPNTYIDLSRADLSGASLIETNLEGSILTGCKIYGISAWKLELKDSKQNDLVITPHNEPDITVDNLEVAQFIYLLIHNEKIRGVIDIIAKKAILILGRFTPERKAVLDALRVELRNRGYLLAGAFASSWSELD